MKITLHDPAPGYPQAILGPAMAHSPTGPRSKGLHLTDILWDMADTAGIGKDQSGFRNDDLDWFACGGWLWERIWDMAHRDAIESGDIEHAGEFESEEGIFLTPDRIDWRVPKLVELKARWRSASTFDSPDLIQANYWIELMQIASYCHVLQIMKADLVVFFVAGYWKPPIPTVMQASIEFGEAELKAKWQAVTDHARWKGWL